MDMVTYMMDKDKNPKWIRKQRNCAHMFFCTQFFFFFFFFLFSVLMLMKIGSVMHRALFNRNEENSEKGKNIPKHTFYFDNGTENKNGAETTVNETLNSLANGNKYGLNNEIIID